jgi:preprotein translocase subunit SecE
MARDRKRAKQRRDRARRAPAGAARSPRARRDESAPADLGPRSLEETPDLDEAPDPLDEAPDRLDEAPDPLEHASAEVDLAEARLAIGRDEFDDDGEPPAGQAGDPIAPDELDDDADRAAGAGGRLRRAGGPAATDELPERRERAPVSANRVAGFLQASWRELQRVQWPDRRQVSQATGVVIAFVIIAGLFLGAADLVFQKLVDAIL